MTTQINVIVDNGGLSEKARRQTQANRWSKLESANRQKVEAIGTRQRDANRSQQGIGPDGQPLYGTPARSTLRRDEPGAFRMATGYPVAGAFLTYGRFTGSTTLRTFTIETLDQQQTVTVPTSRPDDYSLVNNLSTTITDRPATWQENNPSSPNYIPLPISWTGSISGTRSNFSNSTSYYTNPRVISFPAGGQNLILYYSEETVKTVCTATWSATATASVFVDGNGQRQAAITQTTTPETQQIDNERTVVERAWIISPTAIREITLPSAFLAAVRPFAPTTSAVPTYTPSELADSTAWMTRAPSGTVNNWFGNNYHNWGVFLSNYATSPTGTSRFFLSSPWFDNFYSFGLAYNEATNDADASVGSGSAIWTTPAVFDMLARPADIRTAYNSASGDRYSFAYVLSSNLLTASALPSKYLGYTRQSDNEARFDIASVLPATYYDYSNAVPLKKNTKGEVAMLTPGEEYTNKRMTFAWDWGKPSYCRQQLLALGFASSDLTP